MAEYIPNRRGAKLGEAWQLRASADMHGHQRILSVPRTQEGGRHTGGLLAGCADRAVDLRVPGPYANLHKSSKPQPSKPQPSKLQPSKLQRFNREDSLGAEQELRL